MMIRRILLIALAAYLSAGAATCSQRGSLPSSLTAEESSNPALVTAGMAKENCKDVNLSERAPLKELKHQIQGNGTCYAATALNVFYSKLLGDGVCNRVPELPTPDDVEGGLMGMGLRPYYGDSAWEYLKRIYAKNCKPGGDLVPSVLAQVERGSASVRGMGTKKDCSDQALVKLPPLTGPLECVPGNVPCAYVEKALPKALTWGSRGYLSPGDLNYTRRVHLHFNALANDPNLTPAPIYGVIRENTLEDGKTSGTWTGRGNHAVTLMGQRWNPAKSRCEFLVRNSYPAKTEYHSDWERAKDQSKGEIWVDAARLSIRNFATTKLYE